MVGAGRNVLSRCQVDDGGGSRSGQGWDGKVTGKKRKTPGLGQWHIIVQLIKIN